MAQLIHLADPNPASAQVIALDSLRRKNKRVEENYVRNLQIGNLISRTLDVDTVVQSFFDEISTLLNCCGYRYECRDIAALIEFGEVTSISFAYNLKVENQNLGEIILYGSRQIGTEKLAELEELLCALIYPLRNAFQYSIALKSAFLDPLTGLNNRAAMESFLSRELEICKRHNQDMAILVMDLDGFKEVNDQYGHDVGDQVLRSVGQVMEQAVRNTDLLYRYGGDEFVCGLLQTGTDGAMDVAERIRAGVEVLKFGVNTVSNSIEISIGITLVRNTDVLQDAFKRADRALYQAKNNGKNQIIFA